MNIKKIITSFVFSVAALGTFNAYAQASDISVGFSPEGSASELVLSTINSAQKEIRMMAYSFTDPSVVKSLMNAKKKGIDIKLVVDEKGNKNASSTAAKNLIVGAGIPLRTNSTYPIQHDKVIIVDRKTVETGSYNYSKAASNRNSENVIVIRNNTEVASQYLDHWNSRWDQGYDYQSSY